MPPTQERQPANAGYAERSDQVHVLSRMAAELEVNGVVQTRRGSKKAGQRLMREAAQCLEKAASIAENGPQSSLYGRRATALASDGGDREYAAALEARFGKARPLAPIT